MIETLYDAFKHWSATGSVYILSDLHFNDPDCKLMSPDWIDPEEQLRIINSMITKNDTFICLGDTGEVEYIKRIKAGRKVLIAGNHDKLGECRKVFDEVYSGALFISDKILLSHERVYGLTWCFNIHGHDHNDVMEFEDEYKHLNVAANVFGYTPMNLGLAIKQGMLSRIDNIHRQTIDKAMEKKYKKQKSTRKHDVKEINLQVDGFYPFKNDIYEGVTIEWSSNIGFGEYQIYINVDSYDWYADFECMDSNEDKQFVIELMRLFIEKLKIK